MRTRYKADYYMSSTPNRIKDLTNKIKVILNESRTYRQNGYICCYEDWIRISGKANYDENNNEISFEFELFGAERIDPADGWSVCLNWTELDESKLDDKQKEEYLKKHDEINKELNDPKNYKWQQIIDKEYMKCRKRYSATLEIIEGLKRQTPKKDELSLIVECFDYLFKAYGNIDPVTTRRMSDYFGKNTPALLLVDRYIYCKTEDYGYVVLDSDYMLLSLPSPVVFCQNDLYHSPDNKLISNANWYKKLLEYSADAYNFLKIRSTTASTKIKK